MRGLCQVGSFQMHQGDASGRRQAVGAARKRRRRERRARGHRPCEKVASRKVAWPVRRRLDLHYRQMNLAAGISLALRWESDEEKTIMKRSRRWLFAALVPSALALTLAACSDSPRPYGAKTV